MRKRKQRSGVIYYYYEQETKEGKRPEIPLGSDYPLALKKYAELEIAATAESIDITTFQHVANQYLEKVVPLKSASTQRNNKLYLTKLSAFFNDPPARLSDIEPLNIRQYLDWRVGEARRAAELKNEERRQKGIKELEIENNHGHVIANREIALFSAIWNYARESGYTKLANPCQGITKFRELGRDVYIEDDVNNAVYAAACQTLRDCMDLAYLTGQRPSDTIRMSETDIKYGALSIRTGKTKKKIRIALKGSLEQLIGLIRSRKKTLEIHSLRLIVNEKGEGIRKDALRYRFDKARERAIKTVMEKVYKTADPNVKERLFLLAAAIDEFQFRDLRAKAGTDKADDTGDIRKSQKLLGHTTVAMTEHYIRDRRGAMSDPTK
ncbi:tyrosine-type recombinase/integrase [Chitinimonas sp. PSY-7]|uniref:tyrosine-type recombinase/integrase n=1 Tax=Chitinimonas sp. PSY-7 TaxID=3459088 RepID=UPI0040400DED